MSPKLLRHSASLDDNGFDTSRLKRRCEYGNSTFGGRSARWLVLDVEISTDLRVARPILRASKRHGNSLRDVDFDYSSNQEGFPLDFSLGRVRFDSTGSAGCLGDSASWEYGCTYYRAGCQAAGLVDLLRVDGHGGFGDRKLSYVPARAQGRGGNDGGEALPQEHEHGYQKFRAMGIWRNRYPGTVAAADAAGAVCSSRGCYQVSSEEIPRSAHLGANCKVQRPVAVGCAVRA